MTDSPVFARREFLTKLTAAVGGSATLAVTSSLVQAAPTPSTDQIAIIETPKTKGYQRTEHVDTYYHLADF